MPNKNTERHMSGKGTLIAIFEKRKVRWERKRGGERRRMCERKRGVERGSLFILLLLGRPLSLRNV